MTFYLCALFTLFLCGRLTGARLMGSPAFATPAVCRPEVRHVYSVR